VRSRERNKPLVFYSVVPSRERARALLFYSAEPSREVGKFLHTSTRRCWTRAENSFFRSLAQSSIIYTERGKKEETCI